jgi:hypothetical protein
VDTGEPGGHEIALRSLMRPDPVDRRIDWRTAERRRFAIAIFSDFSDNS